MIFTFVLSWLVSRPTGWASGLQISGVDGPKVRCFDKPNSIGDGTHLKGRSLFLEILFNQIKLFSSTNIRRRFLNPQIARYSNQNIE